jgi:hypothetical protein
LLRPEVVVNTIVRCSSASLALACALVAACNAEPQLGPAEPLPFEEVLSTPAMTGIQTPTYRLIMDPDSWDSTWAAIHSNYAPGQVPSVPVIDFGSKILVLAAAGWRGAQGFFFRIEEVRASQGVLHVTVAERYPFCGTLPATSAPVHVVSIPRVGTTAEFTLITQRPVCS